VFGRLVDGLLTLRKIGKEKEKEVYIKEMLIL
jgi:hypothetical protein